MESLAQDNNHLLEPTMMENNTKIHNRRQLSHGLEINTNLSKTNAFFNASDIPTPRPPPSISRKISIKQNTHPVEPEEVHHETSNTYASRLRNLVSGARQTSVAPAPIPQYLNKIPTEQVPSPTSFSEDEIIALPTPKPSHSGEMKRKYLITKKPEQIPVITSCLSPSIPNHLPKLSNEPMLGDYAEQSKKHQEIQNNAIHVMDEDVIGKQIGSFRISKLLGVGAFSKVYVGDHLEEKKFYALKIIQKGKLLNDARIRSKGGELFDFVQKMHYQSRLVQQKVNEVTIKSLFLQLVNAVRWLHEHHIVHRDLKLENILIHKQNEQVTLKITDFGLARVVDPEAPLLTTRCGSEEYAAPEIVQGKEYDGRKTDTWALGIILYALLVGYLPFRYDTRKQEKVSQLFYRIVKAEVKWPTDDLSEISSEAKFVVSRILERNPEKRIHINDIEHLPWFNL
ncbi:hypothetical protein RO3G_10332 [Rhizopus delemar RA 99-880]|uniref:non-specific serine/threonine protein kinase n=1 Tax=Rhizopus delemar (strain RA 99-880 / ATCC MYA-4621 / FGSC 9543 / NRRL 43880) TaxID=246409 RepID=I1CAZ2_RHIO9|nr:hypothetical protein RO3G_10332 [Rhizopus delemar RA 99-880]|eukprot:EIE85622.1 hypothetical protein RO3G_10332 [Rhizopus delemar RA 99-880]